MRTFESLLGWTALAIALYIPSTVMISAGAAIAGAIRPTAKFPKAILRTLSAAVAIALWYCIPIVVHAYLGRAAH